ncbi:MAG: hypothetical protein ACJAXX_002900, partial [Roseivirga sp.]
FKLFVEIVIDHLSLRYLDISLALDIGAFFIISI